MAARWGAAAETIRDGVVEVSLASGALSLLRHDHGRRVARQPAGVQSNDGYLPPIATAHLHKVSAVLAPVRRAHDDRLSGLEGVLFVFHRAGRLYQGARSLTVLKIAAIVKTTARRGTPRSGHGGRRNGPFPCQGQLGRTA